MPPAQVQKLIIKQLQANSELSLTELVQRVRPNAPTGRNEIKAAVVPLLYRRDVTLTPDRKFKLGS